MDFFEGDGSRVRPVCTVSSLSSGILKTIGTMIGHSIIMSNIGFPLSRVMYYLIQNSQAVKKVCGPQKGYGEKRCEIQGGGQEMAVMVG